MNQKIKKNNCIKFEKLIYSSLCDKLNPENKKFFEKHLLNCENCKNKYEVLKNIRNDFQDLKNKILPLKNKTKPIYSINEYKNFKDNLSAYVDNELNIEETIKMKKFIIINNFAKKDFCAEQKLKEKIKLSVDMYKNRIKKCEMIRNFLFLIKKQEKI